MHCALWIPRASVSQQHFPNLHDQDTLFCRSCHRATVPQSILWLGWFSASEVFKDENCLSNPTPKDKNKNKTAPSFCLVCSPQRYFIKGLQLFLTCNGSNPGYKQRFVHRQRFHPSPAEWRKVLGGVDRRKGVGGGAKGHSGPPTAQALGCSMQAKWAQPLTSASSIPQFGIAHCVLFGFKMEIDVDFLSFAFPYPSWSAMRASSVLCTDCLLSWFSLSQERKIVPGGMLHQDGSAIRDPFSSCFVLYSYLIF